MAAKHFALLYFACLYAGEVDKMSKKMAKVEEVEVPVVTEEFLEDASKGGALLKIPSHTISSWGAPRHSLAAPEDETDAPMAFKSSGTPQNLTHHLTLFNNVLSCRFNSEQANVKTGLNQR